MAVSAISLHSENRIRKESRMIKIKKAKWGAALSVICITHTTWALSSGNINKPPVVVTPPQVVVVPPPVTDDGNGNGGVIDFRAQIKDIASKSACRQVIFTGRGKPPLGYLKGMALTYARSLCRIRATPARAGASVLAMANTGNTTKDVLAWYDGIVSPMGLRTNSIGADPVHATYSIGIGLGMRESSGRYCVGWDASAGSNRSSAEAEAGLFQASYDSINAHAELRKLYDEYRAEPSRCHLDVFKEGASCSSQSILGTGAGAEFQKFAKDCPAFDTEYTMVLIRVLRRHFGPLNIKSAQVVPSCESMLSSVRQFVNSNPNDVCSQIF